MCGGVGSIITKGGSNVNPCVKAKLKRPLLGCRGDRRRELSWRAPSVFWHQARIECTIQFGARFAMVAT